MGYRCTIQFKGEVRPAQKYPHRPKLFLPQIFESEEDAMLWGRMYLRQGRYRKGFGKVQSWSASKTDKAVTHTLGKLILITMELWRERHMTPKQFDAHKRRMLRKVRNA